MWLLVKYSLDVLNVLLPPLWLRLFLHPTYSGSETNEPDPGMCAVEATTQLNVWSRLCIVKSTVVFPYIFGPLDHFKVDCEAEELAQGLHLVSLMKDTGLEKDSPASGVLRVYYEPSTSFTSGV